MSKEKKLVLPHYLIAMVERHKKDNGCVLISKTTRKNQAVILGCEYSNDMNDFFSELIDYVAELEAELMAKTCEIHEFERKELEINNWKTRYEMARDDLFMLKEELAKKNKQLNQYPYHYSEKYMADYKKIEATNKALMELKAKEMGEALSDAFNNFTVAIRNKLSTETILEYLRTHNDDKMKMLEDIKESLEDIADYLLKKGDITDKGSNKILDYIDCKIEQQKGQQ